MAGRPSPIEAYAAAARAAVDAGAATPAGVLASVAHELARRRGLDPAVAGVSWHEVFGERPRRVAVLPALPDGVDDPAVLGVVHEALLAPATRRRTGAHFTPPSVARALVDAVLDLADGDLVARLAGGAGVCDPACGGGAFVLAGAESVARRAGVASAVAAAASWGAELDARAAAVTRAVLRLWAGDPLAVLDTQIVAGDSLVTRYDALWPALAHAGARDEAVGPGRFALVVGNPPFLNQLAADTARAGDTGAAARARFGRAARGYVDTAALFLLGACELVEPGGWVVLVQPQSLLATAGAARVRAELLERADLAGLWCGGRSVFAASVHVVAPVLRRRGVAGRPAPASAPAASSDTPIVARWTGGGVEPAPPWRGERAVLGDSWAPLVADLHGLPAVPAAATRGVLGDLASATAGFRDEYYALVPAVRDLGPDEPEPAGAVRLATVGMVDPLHVSWGERPVRFAGAARLRPVVEPAAVAPDGVRVWLDARLTPKVLVATQSRVVEAALDAEGRYAPVTPLVAVHAPADRLGHVAAVLTNPYTTLVARHGTLGTALSDTAIKLSARQVLALALPAGRDAWDDAAALAVAAGCEPDPAARRVLVERVGATMLRAYGIDEPGLLAWWVARLAPMRAASGA